MLMGVLEAKKCKELLGYSSRTHIKDRKQFKKYMKNRGIADIKNVVDVVATTGKNGLVGGCKVGYVRYLDGRFEDIIYKDSGSNDVKYKRRNGETTNCKQEKDNVCDRGKLCNKKTYGSENPVVLYAYGKIGESELRKRISFVNDKNILESREVSLWMKKYGVNDIKNYVDIIADNESDEIYPGRKISEIIHDSGVIELVLYNKLLERENVNCFDGRKVVMPCTQ